MLNVKTLSKPQRNRDSSFATFSGTSVLSYGRWWVDLHFFSAKTGHAFMGKGSECRSIATSFISLRLFVCLSPCPFARLSLRLPRLSPASLVLAFPRFNIHLVVPPGRPYSLSTAQHSLCCSPRQDTFTADASTFTLSFPAAEHTHRACLNIHLVVPREAYNDGTEQQPESSKIKP